MKLKFSFVFKVEIAQSFFESISKLIEIEKKIEKGDSLMESL
jgi:hypothetical protein